MGKKSHFDVCLNLPELAKQTRSCYTEAEEFGNGTSPITFPLYRA